MLLTKSSVATRKMYLCEGDAVAHEEKFEDWVVCWVALCSYICGDVENLGSERMRGGAESHGDLRHRNS
jgi:hypothetical protein